MPAALSAGFLASSEPDDRDELVQLGAVRRFRRGDVLFHQGDDAGAVLVLVHGHVKTAQVTGEGREIILGFPGPGELLGELSAVDGHPRSGTVRALEAVEALAIPGAAFRAFIEHRPRIAVSVRKTVIARLREADRQRVDHAVHDVVVRVARRLVELCDRFGDAEAAVMRRPAWRSTQDELAAGPARVARGGGQGDRAAADARLDPTERRRIVVLDLDALRRYAG